MKKEYFSYEWEDNSCYYDTVIEGLYWVVISDINYFHNLYKSLPFRDPLEILIDSYISRYQKGTLDKTEFKNWMFSSDPDKINRKCKVVTRSGFVNGNFGDPLTLFRVLFSNTPKNTLNILDFHNYKEEEVDGRILVFKSNKSPAFPEEIETKLKIGNRNYKLYTIFQLDDNHWSSTCFAFPFEQNYGHTRGYFYYENYPDNTVIYQSEEVERLKVSKAEILLYFEC